MFITIHAVAATLIGKKVASAPLAFILGIISHFILDIIPHGDQKLGKKFFGFSFNLIPQEKKGIRTLALYGIIDAFALIGLLLYLFRTFEFADSDSVAWAIIGGILPDALVGIYVVGKFKFLKWFFELHSKIHYFWLDKMKKDIPLKWGVLMQIITLIFIFWLIALF
ncbi:hypothetical protein HZA71_02195 [Candidatus Falkowbacteria bacterium]|nr:hypothetical protein [Candidatus Falkowbacteria bacterium]